MFNKLNTTQKQTNKQIFVNNIKKSYLKSIHVKKTSLKTYIQQNYKCGKLWMWSLCWGMYSTSLVLCMTHNTIKIPTKSSLLLWNPFFLFPLIIYLYTYILQSYFCGLSFLFVITKVKHLISSLFLGQFLNVSTT